MRVTSAPPVTKHHTTRVVAPVSTGPLSTAPPCVPAVAVAHDAVVFSPWLRRCLWLALLIILTANTALLVDAAVTFQQYDVFDSRIWFFRVGFLSNDGNLFVERAALIIAAGYACLAAMFCSCAVYLICVSIQSRGLFFGRQPTTATRPTRWRLPTIKISFGWWRALKRKLTKAQYLVSIQGPYFETRLLLDDTMELFSQTAAAFAASHRVSNVAFNLTYGIVIFLTSIVPSVSIRVFRHSLARHRIACLVADLVLEFVWGSVLPYWMASPVRSIYDNRASNAGQLDSYSDPSREIESVLVLSWFSYLLSVIPFISTLLNLVEIQSILQQLRPSLSPQSLSVPEPTKAMLQRHTSVLTLTYSTQSSRRQHVLLRILHRLIPVYGLGVLITSIFASRLLHVHGPQELAISQRFDCIHRVNPWFMVDEACVGRRINCSSAGIQGRSEEIDAVLARFNAQALRDLFITDCPQLTMPPGIRRFTGLQSIAVSKSYIVQWSHEDAALVDAYFPELLSVKLIDSYFETILTGLVAQPLASNVDWVFIAGVPNASLLLDVVGDHWKNLRFFNCIFCGLVEYPAVLKTMDHIAMIHLAFNDIQEIPEDWNADPSNVELDAIWLAVNPRLKTLPDSLWRRAMHAEIVSMENTGLTVIPEWLADVVTDPGVQIFASGSPVCAPGASPEIPLRVRSMVKCKQAGWKDE